MEKFENLVISNGRMRDVYFYKGNLDRNTHKALNVLCEWNYISEDDFKKYESMLLDAGLEEREIVRAIVECYIIDSDEKIQKLKDKLDGFTR